MSSTPPSTSSDGNAVDFGISAAEILAARGGNGLRSERGGWRGRGRGRGGSRGVPGGHIDSIPSYSGSTLSSDFAEHTTPHQSQPAQPEPHITLTTEENSTGAHPQHTYAIEDDNVELIMDPNSIRKASEGVTWRKILAAYKFEDAEITTIVRRLSLRKISEKLRCTPTELDVCLALLNNNHGDSHALVTGVSAAGKTQAAFIHLAFATAAIRKGRMQAPPGPPANMCLVDIRPHDSPYGYSSQRATSANTDENNKRGIERHHTFAYELMKGVAVEDRDSEMPDDELNRQLGDNSETSIYAPPRISAQERLQNKLQTMRPLASTYSIEDDGQEVKSRVIRQARQVSQQDKRSGNIGRDDGEYIDAYEDQVVEHGPKRSYRDIRMPPGVFKTADPNLQILSDARPDPVPTDYTNTPWPAQFIKPLGMMVVPTVAEADITWDMVEVLSAALELRIVIIRGHSHDQLDILQAKDCDIIVGTPGKLYCLSSVSRPSITNEHGVEYNLDLSEMAMVVLDCVDVLIKQPLAIHLYDRLRRQDCSHPRTVFTSTWNALTDVYRFFALNPLSIRILQVGTPELALSNVIHHGITIKDNEEFIDMCEKIRQNAHSLGNQVVCVASKLELARTFFQDYAQKYKRRAVLFHAESKNRDIILEGIISGEFSMIVGSEAFLTTFSFPKKVTALIHIDEAASERQYLARLGMIGRQWRYGGMPGISFMLVAKDNARDIRLALRKLAEERPKANISLRDIEQSEDLVKTAITDVQIKKAQISKARLDLHISIVKEGPKVHATRDLVGKSPSTDDHSTTRETEEQHSLDDALD